MILCRASICDRQHDVFRLKCAHPNGQRVPKVDCAQWKRNNVKYKLLLQYTEHVRKHDFCNHLQPK